MIKYIGQHIFNFIATFRQDVLFKAKATIPTRVYDLPGTVVGNHTSGDIVYSTGDLSTTTNAGKIYYLNSSNVWTISNADAAADASGILAVALGSTPASGMLLRGIVTLVEIQGSEDHGQKIYLNTVDGSATIAAPTGSGHIVRIIGYSLGNTSTNSDAVYFNPDNTYVEIA